MPSTLNKVKLTSSSEHKREVRPRRDQKGQNNLENLKDASQVTRHIKQTIYAATVAERLARQTQLKGEEAVGTRQG